MDKQADRLLSALDNEIEKKCYEIKQKRKEQMWTKLFVLLCIAFITIPAVLVFIGVSLAAFIIPILFISLSFLFFSPLLIRQE